MDRSAKEITFDADGVCNFCEIAQTELLNAKVARPNLINLLDTIKADGKGKDYDCLIGLSGGVDSSYLLHLAHQYGLRPLCFSVDNGWNDPKADENIMRIVETLKVPFYRHVLDQVKFRELQMAFLKAGLVNAEIPTDHVLMAFSFELAKDYGIKWILSGGNVATESIMPASWSYNARDLTHIKDVYRWATGKKLTGLPLCSLFRWNVYKWWYKIKTVYLLDYGDYNREEAIKILGDRYGYQSYGEKHCESTFTWWFQNYYLFEKFSIDKRKAHFSSLINSGQMTRETALELLQHSPVYPQIGLEKRVMGYRRGSHDEFTKDVWYDRIAWFLRLWK